jgi:hypothetical protein
VGEDGVVTGWQRTAVDGAVVSVDSEPSGWAVNCTVCGYVCSDPDDERWIEDQAEHHEGWHETEYEREKSRH